MSEIRAFGTLSLLIFLVILLSLFSFVQFNTEPNNTISDSTTLIYGANINNLQGAVTNFFFHRDSVHLVNNIRMTILLLFIVFVLESKDHTFAELEIFRWIILPLILSNIILIVINAYLGITKYSIGLSLFDTYVLGYLITIGWRRILEVPTNGIREYLEICRLKKLNRVAQHILFLFIFFLLVASTVSVILNIGTTIANASEFGFDKVWSEVAHLIGLAIGFAVGQFWIQKNQNSELLKPG